LKSIDLRGPSRVNGGINSLRVGSRWTSVPGRAYAFERGATAKAAPKANIQPFQEDRSMKTCIVTILCRAAIPVMLAVSVLTAAALAGVTLPDTLKSGETTLKLNGLGLRKKAMFKVYVGGLYLESPSKDAGAILATDQAKAIRMHFLRDLTKAQLVEAFQEGFDANAKDKTGQKAAFDKMLALVPDVKEGDTLMFTYLPGKGTTLQVGNKELGVFVGKGFGDAVFSIFLGPKPPSEDLKKGMLGM
jgi:hypothetical protein